MRREREAPRFWGETFRAKGQVLLVHVAQGDDVLAGDAVEMGFAAAPGAEQGDVELVAGGVGSEEPGPRQDEPGGSGEGDGFEEVRVVSCAESGHREARGVKQRQW